MNLPWGIGHRPALAILLAATTIIVVLSLSIHVVMLQVLGIPYPDASGIGRWRTAVPWAQAFGCVGLAAVIVPSLRSRGFVVKWLVVASLIGAINGIVRAALMAGVVTTSYAAPIAGLTFQTILFLVLAAIIVAGIMVLRGAVGRIGLAIGIGALWLFVLLRGLGLFLAPLMAWAGRNAHPEVYTLPYGPNVLIPSYVSFAETVFACIAVRYLGSFPVRGWDPRGFWRFAAIILLARGTLATTLIWGPMIGPTLGAGLVSVGQFFLQDLAMVMLVHLLFVRATWLLRRALSGA